MNTPPNIMIFGEVLFDCFPTGEKVLGGAPFNVAWHLQAFGDAPELLSRVGDDPLGREILAAMDSWGMNISGIQTDPLHQTGRVDIELIDNEPNYSITPDCAYDFIDADAFNRASVRGILYHGTLGMRNEVSRNAFTKIAENPDLSIFLDVNLRAPWWHKEDVYRWLKKARWAKLNQDELRVLGFTSTDIRQAMASFQSRFQLEQIILTLGEQGATVRCKDGQYHHIVPEKERQPVDTVGAGDAFSAVYIHGLLSDWPIPKTLSAAQRFAAKVIGLRGATTTERAFYREFAD